jgi:ABC-type transport system involved in multi-copper enzyme maturation permease subunit
MVAVALAFHLRHTNRLTLGAVLLTGTTALAMLLAIISNVYPNVPPAPMKYFPFIYVLYLGVAMAWMWGSGRRKSFV